jgi:hypothetical protein
LGFGVAVLSLLDIANVVMREFPDEASEAVGDGPDGAVIAELGAESDGKALGSDCPSS